MDRSQEIIRTSWIGIIANVLLAGFKAAVGILASSVAIVMDAVNNLSDALSSVITIVGTKLSQRPADRKHPFGAVKEQVSGLYAQTMADRGFLTIAFDPRIKATVASTMYDMSRQIANNYNDAEDIFRMLLDREPDYDGTAVMIKQKKRSGVLFQNALFIFYE